MGYPYPPQQYGPPQGPGMPTMPPSGTAHTFATITAGFFALFTVIYITGTIDILDVASGSYVLVYVVRVICFLAALAGVILLMANVPIAGFVSAGSGALWILMVLLTPLITDVPFGLYFKLTFDSSKNETGVAVAAIMAIPVIVLGVLPMTSRYLKFKRDYKKGLIALPGIPQPYPMQMPQQGYPMQQPGYPQQGYPQPGYPQPGQAPGYPPQQTGGYPPPPPPPPPNY